jgi:catechol 2,3-dioxygenase-like lactoylglutathione lyase family enzyme
VHRSVACAEPIGQTAGVLTLGLVVIGVNDLARATTFWSKALDYRVRKAHASARWQELEPAPGRYGCPIALQLSETAAQEYPRIHLDLEVDSAAAQKHEATRLQALGARHVDWDQWPDDPDFIVMEDTEGNRFCIVDVSHVK